MSDTEEVTRLVLRERQGRDRGWWAEMEQASWPDSRVTILLGDDQPAARDEFYRRTWEWLRGDQEK